MKQKVTMLEILNQLAAVSGRNDKMAILQANKDNELLKRFFHLALDPMVTFGIKKIPAYVKMVEPVIGLNFAFDQLNQLIKRDVTGNAAIDMLANLLCSLSADDAEVLKRVIEKDPKCGVADSSVNKVWTKLVFEFPVMKATPYDEKTIQNVKFPAISQQKLDGARCCFIVDAKSVVALSSSGREIETHGQFNWLSQIVNGKVVFDGELLVTEATGKFMERKAGNGIVNRAVKGTIPVAQAKQLHFVCFDVIPYDKWTEGYDAVPYGIRFKNLCEIAANFKHNASVVAFDTVESEAYAVVHFKQMLTAGEEGTILKDLGSPWEGKRSKQHIKMKGLITCDLEVVAIQEGTGKNEGKIGALVCRSADGAVEVNVGTGLTDADRELNPNAYIGSIIECGYNERIINKGEGSKWSLFLPRFIRVRIDKDVADTIDNIPLKAT
jgi:ATP-dependent DNA ligase